MEWEAQHRDLLRDEREASVEDLQAKVDRLQEVMCALLMKNQNMRMALSTGTGKEDKSSV